MIARGLHVLGRRREKEFLAINCAELPESILESELFGYTRGAFTGARHRSDRALRGGRGGYGVPRRNR